MIIVIIIDNITSYYEYNNEYYDNDNIFNDEPINSIVADFGKGQVGSALVVSRQFSCVLTEGFLENSR